jgi:phosphohistidine swiveling domain-containing protein
MQREYDNILTKDVPQFPILRGESVSESGEFSGATAVVCTPEDLQQDWSADTIVVLADELEVFFNDNPKALADLFNQVRVVIAEFGESIGQFATIATENSAIGIVGVKDATHGLENGMHLRIEATENQADIFFID